MKRQGSTALGVRDRKSMQRAAGLLRSIAPGGAPSAVFDALRSCAPVIGGLIGVMGERMDGAAISHVVGLPSDVLEGWTSTPLPLLHRMMAPLIPASPGELISDRTAIVGPLREELELLAVMRRAGLGESAGYKVAVRAAPSGRAEHCFVTIALDSGAAFSPSQHEVFGLLQPEIDAALSRMAVPLVAFVPILAQIVEETELGYLCLSQSGGVRELNARAPELARAYLPAARIEGDRGWLQRFAGRTLEETSRGRPWHLVRPDHRGRLEIRAHRLPAGVQGLAEPVTLLVLRESGAPAGEGSQPRAERLTPRQQEVVRQLVMTGRSRKQIAADLGIAYGTLHKHVEHVYSAYGVQSRSELITRLR